MVSSTVEVKHRGKIVNILNENDILTKIPFFPGMSGTCFDPNEALYNELSYPENKIYYLAKYGESVDFDNEIEIDFDKYEENIGNKYVSIMVENGIPPWIQSITYSHISVACNSSLGDLYVKIKYSEGMFKKILKFLKENKEFCEKRLYEIFQYLSYYDNTELKNIEYWFKFFKNPSYYKHFASYEIDIIDNNKLYTML